MEQKLAQGTLGLPAFLTQPIATSASQPGLPSWGAAGIGYQQAAAEAKQAPRVLGPTGPASTGLGLEVAQPTSGQPQELRELDQTSLPITQGLRDDFPNAAAAMDTLLSPRLAVIAAKRYVLGRSQITLYGQPLPMMARSEKMADAASTDMKAYLEGNIAIAPRRAVLTSEAPALAYLWVYVNGLLEHEVLQAQMEEPNFLSFRDWLYLLSWCDEFAISDTSEFYDTAQIQLDDFVEDLLVGRPLESLAPNELGQVNAIRLKRGLMPRRLLGVSLSREEIALLTQRYDNYSERYLRDANNGVLFDRLTNLGILLGIQPEEEIELARQATTNRNELLNNLAGLASEGLPASDAERKWGLLALNGEATALINAITQGIPVDPAVARLQLIANWLGAQLPEILRGGPPAPTGERKESGRGASGRTPGGQLTPGPPGGPGVGLPPVLTGVAPIGSPIGWPGLPGAIGLPSWLTKPPPAYPGESKAGLGEVKGLPLVTEISQWLALRPLLQPHDQSQAEIYYATLLSELEARRRDISSLPKTDRASAGAEVSEGVAVLNRLGNMLGLPPTSL